MAESRTCADLSSWAHVWLWGCAWAFSFGIKNGGEGKEMELALVIFLFVVGIVFIVKGGDYFVDAASWIAEVSG